MPSTLSKDMLDPETPPGVNVTDRSREPTPDPTLGIPVTVAKSPALHRLVTIGDSLTHGFQSGAILNTDISWPAIVAWEMGWCEQFRRPHYFGFGGIPLNIEYLIRDLEAKFGDRISGFLDLILAGFEVNHFLGHLDDYWEHGPGSRLIRTSEINHNLAVWGWDLRDALSRTADICAASIRAPKPTLFAHTVSNSNDRTALAVLDSARDAAGTALSPVDAAVELGRQSGNGGSGIETLVVFLGANNALGTVVKLEVIWSGPDFQDLVAKEKYTIWQPEHFQKELLALETKLQTVRAQHVIVATVPHVTIAPIARGIGDKVRTDSRYFPFYARPWVNEDRFHPQQDEHITAAQARAIDSAIDQYNDAIVEMVRRARNAGRDWYVLEVAGLLDRLAARRYIEHRNAAPPWWTPYPLPPLLEALNPRPDSHFFASGPAGRSQGGLFSLDGVHPTTIAYGIVAQEVIRLMERAGVVFYFRDGKSPRPGPVNVDFARLIALDTLISSPPRSLSGDLSLIGWLNDKLDFFKRL